MTPQSTLLTLGQEWQTLRDIVTVVAATDAAAAQKFVSNSTPAMNTRLASTVLFYFVAMQGGVPRTWLGEDTTRALERAGRRDLIDRLGDDFSNLRRLSEERGPRDWRTFLFPFFDGEELQQIRMFTRYADDEEEEDDEEGRRGRSVRFVVDVNLTKLGDLQLDGLVQERRFELIVRSKETLTPEMRDEIRSIFGDGVEATGFEGEIMFETAPHFPISPFEEVLQGAEGDQVRAFGIHALPTMDVERDLIEIHLLFSRQRQLTAALGIAEGDLVALHFVERGYHFRMLAGDLLIDFTDRLVQRLAATDHTDGIACIGEHARLGSRGNLLLEDEILLKFCELIEKTGLQALKRAQLPALLIEMPLVQVDERRDSLHWTSPWLNICANCA